jgi:hypothetical protein
MVLQIWQEAHLQPQDKNLRALEYGDCYKVAVKALMVLSPQVEEEAAKRMHLTCPLPTKYPPNIANV